jgi:hypothetical protein
MKVRCRCYMTVHTPYKNRRKIFSKHSSSLQKMLRVSSKMSSRRHDYQETECWYWSALLISNVARTEMRNRRAKNWFLQHFFSGICKLSFFSERKYKETLGRIYRTLPVATLIRIRILTELQRDCRSATASEKQHRSKPMRPCNISDLMGCD